MTVQSRSHPERLFLSGTSAGPLDIAQSARYVARMQKPLRPFLLRWLITALAVFVATKITGVRCDSLVSLAAASLLLGIVNAFIRPVLVLLSIPFILVTLGLFILVINALMLWFVGWLVPGFDVPSFWNAFFGALIVSAVSWALSALIKGGDGKYHMITHHSQVKQANARVVE